MRKRDEEFLTMTDVVLDIMSKYKNTWQTKVPLSQLITEITDTTKDIKKSQSHGATLSTGFTKDKEAASEDVIDDAVELSGYAQVYARRIHNNALLNQMKIKRKKLEDMEDTAMVAVLEDVHQRLAALGEDAEPYGITENTLAAFKSNINEYRLLKDTPRQVIINRKGENSSQTKLLSEIRMDLKDLDLLMKAFTKTHPQFVNDYRNARIIINRSGGGKAGNKDHKDS